MATRLPDATYLEFWSTADSEEFGLEVKVHPDDQAKFINALYRARDEVGEYQHMMLAQPEPVGTVFIIHKSAELPA